MGRKGQDRNPLSVVWRFDHREVVMILVFNVRKHLRIVYISVVIFIISVTL